MASRGGHAMTTHTSDLHVPAGTASADPALSAAGMPDPSPVPGNRRHVVFLHGYGCSALDWAGVSAALGDDYDRLLPDLPGHGRSNRQAPHSFDELVEYTRHVIEEHSAQPPVIVGHSMGGMVALALAAQASRPPAGLVLADCFPHLPSVVEVFGGAEDDTDPFGYGSVMDRQTPPEVQLRIRQSMAAGAQRAGADLFTSLMQVDLRPTLKNLTMPTLLLLGDRRWVRPTNLASALDRLGYGHVPDLDRRLVPSHHFVMLEQPDMVTRHIRAFLGALDG